MSPGLSTLTTHDLNQKAVYWSSPVNDGFGGRTFAAAVEIDVRWEDKQEDFIDVEGREVQSDSIVYAGQDLDLGGYLFLGELDDLSSNPDPFDSALAREIRQFRKMPDLSGTKFVRKAFLGGQT